MKKYIIFSAFFALTVMTYATEYFVAPMGAGDGTKNAPFGTIDKALAIAQPYDIITLREGTYKAPFYPNDDYINIPHLTIQGYEGEHAHIESPYGSGKKIALWIGAKAEYFTLKNLEISGGDVYTIKLDTYWDWPEGGDHRARHVLIADCEIHHSGTDIIKITPECDDVTIRDSHIHHSGLYYTSGDAKKVGDNTLYPNCQGIDNVNADRMLVQGNHIHDIPYDNPAIFFKGGAIDVVVERNKIEKSYTGIAIGAQTDIDFYSAETNPAPYYNSFNGVVRNNIIKNMRGDCISFMAAKNPKVYNNTLLYCGMETQGKAISFRHQPTWGEGGAMNQPTVNALVVNNLVIGTDPSGSNEWQDFLIEVRGYDDNNILAIKEGSLKMDYNLYWDPRYTDLRVRNYNTVLVNPKDTVTLNQWQQSPLHNPQYSEQNTKYIYPKVEESGALLEGSPAIASGMIVDGLKEDYYGHPRKIDSVDIGAISYGGTVVPPKANETIYEDAENENTVGWSVYDDDPSNTTIENVYDSLKQSRVIHLQGAGIENGYILGNWEGVEGAWETTSKTLSWDMRFNESFIIYVRILTEKGSRYIYYTAYESSYGKSGEYIHFGLGSSAKNGTWQTFTRDLEADLKKFEPNNKLLKVNAFLVRGSGLIDNIKMKKDDVNS